ncbi:MAG: methyltransferase domain-containing protein [Candidatus Competibacteraceae bacterium]|nr:methyltransferase domain-containing protein [Candidatus Competibacteraceae bacterium]
MRLLLAVIILGSFGVYLLPELPGNAHLVLQGFWLIGILLVLTWQIVRLLGTQMHLLCARLGWRTTKAPANYVRALFDDYAERFDQHLMVELAYAAPNRVRSIVGQHMDRGVSVAVDLGCGTGICGPLFELLAERLIGVDLSPAMLDIARKRRVYDELIEADVVDFLRQHQGEFDLCFAADVLVYLGDLRPFLKASSAALKPDAYLAFTVESTTQRDWTLQSSGRYAHSQDYIQTLARHCGFVVEALETATLRTQDYKPVVGDVWLLRRPAIKND